MNYVTHGRGGDSGSLESLAHTHCHRPRGIVGGRERFDTVTSPVASSTSRRSVKVPPMSIPTRA